MNFKRVSTAMVTFIYYFIFVCISFFFASFLVMDKGIRQDLVGYFNAFGVFGFVIVLIVFGQLADSKFGNVKMLLLGFLTSSLLMFLLFITNGYYSLIFYILLIVNYLSLLPIVDGLILKLDEGYTSIRMYGSLGAAVSFFFASTILAGESYNLIIFICISLLIVAFLIMLVYYFEFDIKDKKNDLLKNNNNDVFKENKKDKAAPLFNKDSIKSILKNKTLFPIYILAFLTYGLLGGDDAYNYLYKIQEVKLTGLVIGVVGFFSILIEVLGMNLYEKMFSKIKYQYLMICAITIVLVSNWIKYFDYHNKVAIVISELIIGIFIVIFVPTVVRLVNSNLPKNQLNTGLSLYQVFLKTGAAFFGVLTSLVYSFQQSYHGIYIIYIIVLIPTLIIYTVLVIKKKV